MFLAYDKRKGKLYAKLVKSTRRGDSVHKDYIYLGLVLDKEQGIYKSRKNGIFKYDVVTDTYDYKPIWDGAIESNVRKKSKRELYAFAKGQSEERVRINRLNAILVENDRYEDLKRSFSDEAFQVQLLDELVPIPGSFGDVALGVR